MRRQREIFDWGQATNCHRYSIYSLFNICLEQVYTCSFNLIWSNYMNFPWNSSMISTIIKHFMCCKHTCYFWNILYIDTNGVKFQNQTGNCFCGNTNVDQRFWKKFALTLKLILSSVNPTNIRKGKLCLFVLVSSLACIILWWSDYMMIAERETPEKVIGRLMIGRPWTALVDITH